MPENDSRLVIGATAPERSLAEVATPHPWTTTALSHLASSNAMLTACSAVVSTLAHEHTAARASLTYDPWSDEGFADRFTRRLRWLTRQVLPPGVLRLSDAEDALLVVFPYLHQTFWAHRAVTVLQGADPVEAAFTSGTGPPGFGAFAAGHGALYRRGVRATQTGDAAATSIGWWLFHRWLVRQPECYDPSTITSLLPESIATPLDAVLTRHRLMELMRAVQLDPAYLRRVDRPGTLKPSVRIAGGTEIEQDLHEQLLGYLVVVAHRTAVDPTMLPRVVADHLGIDDGITPDEVLTSIRAATWDGNRTRVLTTDCRHPATALALHDRAAAVDAVLTEIVHAAEESAALAPLKHLPVHASADGTTPTTSAGHRFRLADEQVQALLMGEQLYGTPDLAIRELYQNALDACRYRQARTRYLSRTGSLSAPWQGRIEFYQGVDEKNRPFLECSDNGIGMGERELVEVFAHAGVRFTDMPEYVEEQADWAATGVESFPNSRFGIGVLSYFMLADEITVTTCRLSRSGRPGPRLEVHIAGPDALFRVRDLNQGEEAGTVVRLHLRPNATSVSCTDLLRRILWLSDFTVTSEDPGGRQSWEPRQLSAFAPIGANDPMADRASRTAQNVLATDDARVWWCDGLGAVLADGLWAGELAFGAVIDLVGREQPMLTVNREKILGLDRTSVEAHLANHVHELVSSAGSPLSHPWLAKLSQTMPRLADDICDRAISARYQPWSVGTTEAPIEIVGCFPSDADMLTTKNTAPQWNDRVSTWRLEAWIQADEPDRSHPATVVPARPSDVPLLAFKGSKASLGHVLMASGKTQLSPADVVARLALLGVETVAPGRIPTEAKPTDQDLLRDHVANGEPNDHKWIEHNQPVSQFQVLMASTVSGLSPAEVSARLDELGYDTSHIRRLPADADARLLMTESVPRPLQPGKTVPVAHIMVAAAETRSTPAEVGRQLVELGFATPDPAALPKNTDPVDSLIFISPNASPQDYIANPVQRQQVVGIALAMSNGSPAKIAARLRAAGLDTTALDSLPEHLTPLDRAITREQGKIDKAGLGQLRSSTARTGHVVAAALRTNQRPVDVARRLTELGYECPPAEHLPDDATADDLDLLGIVRTSGPGERYRIWLPTGEAVSLQHIIITAATHAMSPSAVARRMAQFGFCAPEPVPGLTVHLGDLVLLSVNLDGQDPWLDHHHRALRTANATVPLGHALAAAAKLSRPPAEIVGRLFDLGLGSQAATLPARVERQDATLLSRMFPREMASIYRLWEFGWIGVDRPVSARHLLLQSRRTGLSPTEIASRLVGLGFQVTDVGALPSSIDEADEKLLTDSYTLRLPWSDESEMSVARSSIMLMARKNDLSPRGVLDRLTLLGIEVTD
ncbi:hypothetical protein JNUCC0626_17225 [Lentzea sp. JNUCC 0626]|uniref:wHTH domain-containing protein n=1 Tax=Lentzea sp. JNUCC 0626 TaxID=3367513 RepID=UPI003747F9C4